MIFQGVQTSIAKKPYFCDFSGMGLGPLSTPPPPPLDLPIANLSVHIFDIALFTGLISVTVISFMGEISKFPKS